MSAASPYEIMANSGNIYLAADNTAAPYVSATPSSSYTLLGTGGDKNYDEDGIQVTHDQTVEAWRALGTTGPRKVWRTEEMVNIELTVYDLTAEAYRKALNNAAITTTSASGGIPGSKKISLLQGHDVTLYCLLFRMDYSPYADGMKAQYWLPAVWQDENPEPVFKKGEPAGLKLKFSTLEDVSNGFGVVEFQTAAAL